MSAVKSIDVNVISLNGAAAGNQLVALKIDDIAYVYKDNNNITNLIYAKTDDNHTSFRPDRYKNLETLGDIITKANNADFDNGLVTVTVTKANGSTLTTPKTEIINRVKIQTMTPIYNESTGAVEGTRLWYGHWRQTVLEIEENLVINTSSSQD